MISVIHSCVGAALRPEDMPTWAAEVYCSSRLSILDTTGEWDAFTVLLDKKQKQLEYTAQEHFSY